MLSNDTKNTPSLFIDQKLCKFSQPGCQQAFAIASEAIASVDDRFASTSKGLPVRAKCWRSVRLHWRSFANEGEGFALGGDPETFEGAPAKRFASEGKGLPPLAKLHLHWQNFASEGKRFILGGDPEMFEGAPVKL
ncbi:hypothetical protein R1flu_020766 [Riccia fluitans]|uniref:Uncharacterized protein n=1 Tax=Riccia fluitans TaxID=41844 RepID=A0ABD1ZMM3_9MARC